MVWRAIVERLFREGLERWATTSANLYRILYFVYIFCYQYLSQLSIVVIKNADKNNEGEPLIMGEQNNMRDSIRDVAQLEEMLSNPTVDAEQIIRWIADWQLRSGPTLGKPTHFQTRNGKF